jgi:hypothetical protein
MNISNTTKLAVTLAPVCCHNVAVIRNAQLTMTTGFDVPHATYRYIPYIIIIIIICTYGLGMHGAAPLVFAGGNGNVKRTSHAGILFWIPIRMYAFYSLLTEIVYRREISNSGIFVDYRRESDILFRPYVLYYIQSCRKCESSFPPKIAELSAKT